MADLEFFKYPAILLALYVAYRAINFAEKRAAPIRNGNGNGSIKTAGEMAAEHYDRHFEKVHDTLRTQTEILRGIVAILGELRDAAIKAEARRNSGDE